MSFPIIIVEGKADKKFLSDFIKVRFDILLDEDKFLLAGTKGVKNIASRIRVNQLKGEKQLLIFDADESVSESQKQIDKECRDLELEIKEQFFLPNNDTSGNLERLLRNVINPGRVDILSCIDSYGNCLSLLEVPELKEFDEKSKMYVYSSSFKVKNGGKEEQRDYSDTVLWDLNSKYLSPLYNFLFPYFQKGQ